MGHISPKGKISLGQMSWQTVEILNPNLVSHLSCQLKPELQIQSAIVQIVSSGSATSGVRGMSLTFLEPLQVSVI